MPQNSIHLHTLQQIIPATISYTMEKTFSIFILDPEKGILPNPVNVRNEVGNWFKEFLSERHAEKVIERLMNEYDYNGAKYVILGVYSKE